MELGAPKRTFPWCVVTATLQCQHTPAGWFVFALRRPAMPRCCLGGLCSRAAGGISLLLCLRDRTAPKQVRGSLWYCHSDLEEDLFSEAWCCCGLDCSFCIFEPKWGASLFTAMSLEVLYSAVLFEGGTGFHGLTLRCWGLICYF